MEPACLRIKFTPLLQKNQKNNSKCCLEIVPEVSCIQNLDKLTWRQETNFIEYIIPMTYKVILKKRQALNHSSNDEVIKTYHSCVDLLLSPSKSTINCGSGDVSKIISDTFIFCKTVANGTSHENLLDSIANGRKASDMKNYYSVSHKTTNTSLKVIDVEHTEAKENIEDSRARFKIDADQNIESINLDKASLEKLPNTETVYSILSDTVQNENEIINAMSRSKSQSRRKLTLSPICSMNTQDTAFYNKSLTSKAITCKIYDSQKDLVPLGGISTQSDLCYTNLSHELSTIINISGQNSSKRLKVRIPPEIRISNYVEYMEKEVLPLKMILNEIFTKCLSLGITFNKTISKQNEMNESTPTYSCQNVSDSEEVQSNRVVYSIVFDG